MGDGDPAFTGSSPECHRPWAFAAAGARTLGGGIHPHLRGGRRMSHANAARQMARVLESAMRDERAARRDCAPDRVIVVLGYHEIGDDGRHGISSICRAAVRRAEALAAAGAAARRDLHGLVVDGRARRGRADGRGVGRAGATSTCCREPHAVNTAENAVRSLELVRTLEGASEVVLVCSIRHFPRVRFFFDRLYRRHGYATRYRYVVRPLPSLPLVRHELRRSRAWCGTGAGRCACSTRPIRLTPPVARRGYAPSLGRRRQLGRRWACCSIRAAGRRWSPRTSRARSTRTGWHVTLACGSLGRAGALGNAATFFAGIDTVPAAYDDAVARWERGEDPMDAPFPMHPSYEERAGVPDRVVPARVARAGRADGRGLGAADRRVGPRCARARSSTCTTSRRSTRPPPRCCRACPVVTHLHGTELKMLDAIARGEPGVGRARTRTGGPRAWARRRAARDGDDRDLAAPARRGGAAARARPGDRAPGCRTASTSSASRVAAGRADDERRDALARMARARSAGLGRGDRHGRAASATPRTRSSTRSSTRSPASRARC